MVANLVTTIKNKKEGGEKEKIIKSRTDKGKKVISNGLTFLPFLCMVNIYFLSHRYKYQYL
jgi:hypothetical protein